MSAPEMSVLIGGMRVFVVRAVAPGMESREAYYFIRGQMLSAGGNIMGAVYKR